MIGEGGAIKSKKALPLRESVLCGYSEQHKLQILRLRIVSHSLTTRMPTNYLLPATYKRENVASDIFLDQDTHRKG